MPLKGGGVPASLEEESFVSLDSGRLPTPLPPPFNLTNFPSSPSGSKPWPVCFRVRVLLPLDQQFTVWGFLQMVSLPDQFLSHLNSTTSVSGTNPLSLFSFSFCFSCSVSGKEMQLRDYPQSQSFDFEKNSLLRS